ncbi:MAG: dihydrolipoyl dehydrogenase [Bdellovibrionota bacterium]
MTFDVVVIGGGPGGYVAAIRAAQEGFSTALIEYNKLGGECLNYGCIPSKALITAGHLLDKINNASTMGITVQGVKVDLAKLIDWKASIVKSLTGGVGQLLKANGVTHITGKATFSKLDGDKKIITVEGEKKSEITASKVIIASGSETVHLPFLPLDGETVLGSKEALDVKKIPESIIVVGGGFIGLEIGTFYSKLGTKVTIVEATEGLLPGTDRECVDVVAKKLKKKGIEVLLKTKAKSFKKISSNIKKQSNNSAELTVELEDGSTKKLTADWVLVTVGRKPRSKDLGLDKVGVKVSDRGFIEVNSHLETATPGIYAIGDVIGGAMLAHKASKEGLVAVEHMKNPATTIDVKALPWAIFVDPEIAVVGHSEESARAAGWNPVVGKCPFVANGRALTTGEAEGFAKLIVDKDSDRVLGATMVGPDVSNLIMEVAVAIEMGATSHDIALTVHAHPTLPETLMEAAEAVHGKAIHFFQRKAATAKTVQAST